MKDSESPQFRAMRVTIDPTPMPDGRVAYPVPTSPIGRQFTRAICVAPAEDPMRIDSVSLIIERSMVARFASFLARHGGIDREPTEEELSVLMQSIASHLSHLQVDAMAAASEALHATLGDPTATPESVSDAITESMAAEALAATAKAKGLDLTPEEAQARRDELAAKLRQWAEHKLRELDGEEGSR